jgi:hypothetical protein
MHRSPLLPVHVPEKEPAFFSLATSDTDEEPDTEQQGGRPARLSLSNISLAAMSTSFTKTSSDGLPQPASSLPTLGSCSPSPGIGVLSDFDGQVCVYSIFVCCLLLIDDTMCSNVLTTRLAPSYQLESHSSQSSN